jgi:hypothetical protein
MSGRLLALALLVACSASPDESSSVTFATTATGGSSESSSSSAGSTETTGEPAGDPSYPRPDPVEPAGTCPDGSFGPITFDGVAWICIPECGGMQACPDAATGSPEAACATNPYSSATACTTSAECTVDGEMCGNAGSGMLACLLPPTHCILRCDADHDCPDDMTCTLAKVCAYPP